MEPIWVSGLMFLMCLLLLLLVLVCVRLMQRLKNVQESLEDIAQSQRILANNPKSFEETKRINALKKNPYD